MSILLRHFAPNQCCFITAATARRQHLLVKHTDLLLHAFRCAKRTSVFALIAWVILPDHLHLLLYTPDGDIPGVMQRAKLSFSLQLRNRSPHIKSIWQPRYWDHIVRSEEDMRHHLDYIHYNPVKHGWAESPRAWRLSSFHRYVRKGYYGDDWGHDGITTLDIGYGE